VKAVLAVHTDLQPDRGLTPLAADHSSLTSSEDVMKIKVETEDGPCQRAAAS
jgi:hypothetical protein